MNSTEEAHKMTEVIYKNLSENFNPYIRQLLVCGKAYYKAMTGVSVAANAFYDSIASLGSCGLECKGGTEDIGFYCTVACQKKKTFSVGAVFLIFQLECKFHCPTPFRPDNFGPGPCCHQPVFSYQIAEIGGEALSSVAKIQREIFKQIEDSIKSLQTEVIIPLEQKLSEHFKHIGTEYKKYIHGHKNVMGPYLKAADSLRRFKKKNRSKAFPDEQKENHHMQEAQKWHSKVESYRMDGLQTALMAERKYYCFVLDRLCAVTTLQANYHTQASQELARNLPNWLDLTIHPHILPPKAKIMLQRMSNGDVVEPLNGGPAYHRPSNGFMHDGDMVPHHTPVFRATSVHSDYLNRSPHPSVYEDQNYSRTLPRSSISMPPPQGGPQVCAVYNHVREGESQLSFSEGDIISLIGDKADGWQYGYNTKSGKFGWFPLSFTEPLRGDSSPTPLRADLRVRSVGDLIDRGLPPDQMGFRDGFEYPGTPHRRKSFHEGSEIGLVNSTGHPIMSPRLPPPYPPPVPYRPQMSHFTTDGTGHNETTAHTSTDMLNYINYTGSNDPMKMASALRMHVEGQTGIFSSNGKPVIGRSEGQGHVSRPSTPKRDIGQSLPSTPHRESQQLYNTNNSSSPLTERHGIEIRRSLATPPPPPLPPTFPPPPPITSSTTYSVAPKVPNFAPPPLPGHSSSLSLTVPSTFSAPDSTTTHVNTHISSPTPVSQNPQYSEQRIESPVPNENSRQTSGSHHTSPGLPIDYGTDDDGSIMGRNNDNAFSSVKLRKTLTNDRSAPRF